MTEAAEGFEVRISVSYPGWFKDELARLGPQEIPRIGSYDGIR